jgi:DNA-binding NtrC family response regulator
MIPPTILLITGDAEVERAVLDAARGSRRGLNVARTAHEAVRVFSHGFDGFDLIIVDLDPDVHGITLFNALEDCHGKAPVVVVTGCEESYVTPVALARGATGCLGKPVTSARFARLLEDLCPMQTR